MNDISLKLKSIKMKKGGSIIVMVVLVLFAMGYIPLQFKGKTEPVFPPTVKKAKANYQFFPTGGGLVTGTTAPVLGLTAPAAEGVNMGDWRGTLSDDNLHWGFASTAAGYNAYLDIGNVQLNGANKIILQTEFDLDATAPSTFVQICDWSSSVGVANVADAQCTGGGWRTLNVADIAITTVTATAYDWEIYNGYWNSSATSSIATPLTNFVNGSKTMRIRYYSTTNTTSLVNIDYLRASIVVNPVYSASGATIISGGTPVGDYTMTEIGGAGQTGVDATRFRVPGTAGVISDFYLAYDEVHTYVGANTILVRSRYSCSATGPSIKPKIYNFTTLAWEDLTTGTIACSATEATNAWAKTSSTIGDYISGGEVRIGWYGSVAGTQEIRIDMQYIMIGTTNAGGAGTITFGSLSAGTVASTTDLDMTGTLNSWNVLAAAKSNTQAFSTYAFDGDNTITAGSERAANIDFSVTPPAGAVVTGEFYAGRFNSATAGVTIVMGLEDYSGLTSVQGGWSQVGQTSTNVLTYTDNITMASVLSGGAAGWTTNPEDYIDSINNKMNLRLRTSTGGTSGTSQWDFAMVSIQWTEDGIHPSASYHFDPIGGGLVTGTAAPVLGLTAPAAEGVNMGDYRGTEAADNLHWGFASTASGYNAYLDLGNVELNGANKIIIQTTFDLDATVPSTLVQICDWVSATGVIAAADAQCTGGGWRNLNLNDVAITSTTATAYDWEIYDGYWDTNATTKISTPLTNFVSASSTIRIRYFSTTNTTSLVNIDFLRGLAVVDPVYSASGATQITGGAITGNYALANMGGAGQTGIDAAYFVVPGTAVAPSDFYLSYTGVKTYTGVNTILVRASYACTATGPTIRPKIYNFTTLAWEDLTTAAIACSATVATNAWAKSNIANIGDYVSGGEIRIGWYEIAASTVGIRLDMQYVMIGTTNSNGLSELTFGTNALNSVTSTRDLDMTGTANTWNITGAAKSNTQAFSTYAYDSNNNTTAGFASAANIDFAVTVPSNASVTGLFYAARFMSGTTGTVQIGLRDYSGLTSVQGGWTTVGANSTTALIYTDNVAQASVLSGGAAGFGTSPEDFVDTVGGEMNMRLRTTTSGASAATAQWDFAMVSLQWTEIPPPPQSLTLAFSTSTIGFGSLSASLSSYATADQLGSLTETVAHTITAASNGPGGYVLTLDGSSLTSGAYTITPNGGVGVAPTAGIDQFGLRMTAAGGFGVVSSPYNGSGYAFSTTTFPDVVGANATMDSTPTIYSARYVANIDPNQAGGDYAATLTYTLTATF